MKKMKNRKTKKKTTNPSPQPLGQWDNGEPVLRFTPYAWAKLQFLRDRTSNEVGGFGLAGTCDPLLVTDIALVDQTVSPVSVQFDDAGVADHFDRCVDQGLSPDQCGRIWIHTHPGSSPSPSETDERCFDRCFGDTDWCVMFILSQTGKTYGRLRFNIGPGGQIELPAAIDYDTAFGPSDQDLWAEEYDRHVEAIPLTVPASKRLHSCRQDDPDWWLEEEAEPDHDLEDTDDAWWWETEEVDCEVDDGF